MKRVKAAIIFVGVLVLLALANYAFNMDPTQLAARGVGKEGHHHHDAADEQAAKPLDPIKPLGPKGAPVTIEVFYAGEASCRELYWPIMTEVNQIYGDNVRIDFSDLNDPEVNKRARKMTLGGRQGLTINGNTIVHVPGAGAFDKVVFSGSPQDHSWNPQVLHHTIETELAARGIHFNPPAPEIPPEAGTHAGHNH